MSFNMERIMKRANESRCMAGKISKRSEISYTSPRKKAQTADLTVPSFLLLFTSFSVPKVSHL